MASVFRESNGKTRLQIQLEGHQRRSHALGKLTKKQADVVLQRVEALEVAAKSNTSPDAETLAWLKDLNDNFFAKLLDWGFVPAGLSTRLSRAVTIEKAIADCRKQVIHKPGTQKIWDQVEDRAIRHFGKGMSIKELTLADAKGFRTWLLTVGWNGGPYAEATARKTIGIMRQVFDNAKDRNWIESNPFSDKSLPTNVRSNKERKVYVERETVLAAMEQCPNDELRLIVALTRFAGLRCSSEHKKLRWLDINWDQRRMLVHAPKTAHHEGKETRLVPIVDEVFELLEKVHANRPEHSEYVINRYRPVSAFYVWKSFSQAIERAGFTPWPRLFNAMRSSRQTDWAEKFPGHVVCDWMGNSEDVAGEHYLTTKDDHFEKAVEASQEKRAIRVHASLTERHPQSQAKPEKSGKCGPLLRKVTHSDLAKKVYNSPARIRT